MTVAEQERKAVDRLRADPAFFVDDVLGGLPWPKQLDILLSVRDNPRTTVRSCSDSGKSWTAARVAMWFLYTHYPSTVITTAPTWRQVKDILWREIGVCHRSARYPLGGDLIQVSLTIDPKWFAMGISTDEAERFQGFHNENVLVIVDEASGVPDAIFTAVENPLAGGHTRLLLIGNPTQVSGAFYESHRSPIYHKITISAFDTPNFTAFGITIKDIRDGSWLAKIDGRPLPQPYLVSPQWVAERCAAWGEASPMWQCYVMGQFPTLGIDTLIPLAAIEAAQGRNLNPSGVKTMGVDIARYGDDESAALIRQGDVVLTIESWGKTDTMETTGKIIDIARQHGVPMGNVNVDVVGVGAGVVDRLLELGHPVNGVNVGTSPMDNTRFGNLRAEVFWNIRDRFTNGTVDIPDDPVLSSQLASIKYKFTSRGQVMIESKEEMRKRGVKSPDRADAMALAYYTPMPDMVPVLFYDAMAHYEPISPDLDSWDW